ncbi:hypothetical protein K466DRAFT_38003 [Polyporus arcularius HHB13444]|uniref:Uncharacterized protein n=1 Tax=Polyporus arcularius HHB13444 TaxID=1314778 RepID=A0A5C3NPZ2_9APHY|nr:hypothetical protein K466DRAFT_38003 [Polyporus arcularius HHB13444]
MCRLPYISASRTSGTYSDYCQGIQLGIIGLLPSLFTNVYSQSRVCTSCGGIGVLGARSSGCLCMPLQARSECRPRSVPGRAAGLGTARCRRQTSCASNAVPCRARYATFLLVVYGPASARYHCSSLAGTPHRGNRSEDRRVRCHDVQVQRQSGFW